MIFNPPLETKLLAPRVRTEWIERGGLIDYLAGVPARLLLVKAPAGSGKTTLVSQWDSSTAGKRAFAWISLEPEDNDPARMWWRVTSALHRVCPAFDPEAVLAAFGDPVPDFAGTVLPLLLNELGRRPEPVVLVLDDYHVIKVPDCHEQVAFAVQHLPPTGPRGGQQRSTSLLSRCAGTPPRALSSTNSPATAGSSPTSWLRRYSSTSQPKSGSSWPGPEFLTAFPPHSAKTLTGRPTPPR